jgi:acyl-homoserine lactone acylase PvdQ
MTLIGLLSYVSMAEIQADVEKMLVQMIQLMPTLNDSIVLVNVLKEAFDPGLLDGLEDPNLLELLRKIRLARSLFPQELKQFLPSIRASNNWAANASRSKSGNALFAMDPHLDLSTFPGFWYEVIVHLPDNYFIGVTVSGMWPVVMGRSRDVSFSFTYGTPFSLSLLFPGRRFLSYFLQELPISPITSLRNAMKSDVEVVMTGSR